MWDSFTIKMTNRLESKILAEYNRIYLRSGYLNVEYIYTYSVRHTDFVYTVDSKRMFTKSFTEHVSISDQ